MSEKKPSKFGGPDRNPIQQRAFIINELHRVQSQIRFEKIINASRSRVRNEARAMKTSGLSTEQIARKLDISRATVLAYTREGKPIPRNENWNKKFNGVSMKDRLIQILRLNNKLKDFTEIHSTLRREYQVDLSLDAVTRKANRLLKSGKLRP